MLCDVAYNVIHCKKERKSVQKNLSSEEYVKSTHSHTFCDGQDAEKVIFLHCISHDVFYYLFNLTSFTFYDEFVFACRNLNIIYLNLRKP